MAGADRRRLVVWSRAGCGLCDEMIAELAAWLPGRGLEIEVRDVDADAAACTRFGGKVPVLAIDGRLVCHGRLDTERLERELRPA